MKKSFGICLVSAFIFIFVNEILYFFNFTNLTFSIFFNFRKTIYNYLLLFLLIFVILFLLSQTIRIIKKDFYSTFWYYIFSCLFFMILIIAFFESKILNLSVQSAISLFLVVILTSYLFFYSIFYENGVK